MNKVYDIILNMSKENPVFTGITLCQGDSGQTFNLHVTDFDTNGTTASIIFKKPDNNVVQATISAVNGVYSYTLRGSELSSVGKLVADVKFYDTSNQRISSTSFVLEVVADTLNPTAVESSSEFDALVRASNRALVAAEAAEGIVLQAIPTATENILGGVMSGGDVTVNSDGTMSVETIGDISEEPVTFSEAETDTELTSGSKLSILLGIIKKKFNVVNNNLSQSYIPFQGQNAKTPIDISVYASAYRFLTGVVLSGVSVYPFSIPIEDIGVVGRKVEIYGVDQFSFSVTSAFTVILDKLIVGGVDVSPDVNIYYRLFR